MYAIAFDLDTNTLKAEYGGPSWQNGYEQIRNELAKFGFDRQQGSVYFGNDATTAVDCVLAAQHLAKTIAWFQKSVRDIRMLRIEDNNDLTPAIEAVALDLGNGSAHEPVADGGPVEAVSGVAAQ